MSPIVHLVLLVIVHLCSKKIQVKKELDVPTDFVVLKTSSRVHKLEILNLVFQFFAQSFPI